MKKAGTAIAVVSLMLAGLGAVFNSIDVNDWGEALLKLFVLVFSLGGSLTGVAALFFSANGKAKALGAIGVALNAWLFFSVFG